MTALYRRWPGAGRRVLAAMLGVLILWGWILFGFRPGVLASPLEPALMNDRAADIAHSAPIKAEDFIIPGGLSGKGQIIGLADSGLDKGSMTDIHPDLQNEPGKMPRIALLKSYTDRTIPDDPVGHGTHMAATLVGSGQASNGRYQGVAPGASLYFQAILNSQGKIETPTDLRDLFSPSYAAGARIHVDGWGNMSNKYGVSSAQIDKFIHDYPDFLTVFSSGNNGPGSGTISMEANSKNALAIGSSYSPRPLLNPGGGESDQAAGSTSRGPAADGRIKPDLLAPGSDLISACSSLTESNFSVNTLYTRMGGSSMAAAVAGGAAALLSEYLQKEQDLNDPSAALIKSLLINGARNGQGQPGSGVGYGIIDLAATILALQEEMFFYEDRTKGLKQDEEAVYTIQVEETHSPLKVTLGWTDPPAEAGSEKALINDLDLEVTAPDGRVYYGNDFNRQGKRDHINNVEQVTIAEPVAGQYTVRVKAGLINHLHSRQSFALAYGQKLQQGTLKQYSKGKLLMSDGRKQTLAPQKIRHIADGNLIQATENIPAGSEVYWNSQAAYIFSSQWEGGGAQILSTEKGCLVMEMNADTREGGYYIDPEWANDGNEKIMVNGEELTNPDEYPPGAPLQATINPFNQKIWGAQTTYTEVQGNIASIDLENDVLKLLQEPTSYQLMPWTSALYHNLLVDSSARETPFGAADRAEIKNLIPGVKVKLYITPGTRLVHTIIIERELVMGEIREVKDDNKSIVLDTSRTYQVFPGTIIYRDEQVVAFRDLQAGDKIRGLLLPDTNQLLQVIASSQVEYGKVVYYNARRDTLYLMSGHSSIKEYSMTGTRVFRGGSMLGTGALQSGCWVRLYCLPGSSRALRVDIAEAQQRIEAVFKAYQSNLDVIATADGSTYHVSAATCLYKKGYRITPGQLLAGETLCLTILSSPASAAGLLAEVDVIVDETVPVPELEGATYELNGALVLRGTTSADRLALLRSDGSQVAIIPGQDGRYGIVLTMLEQEKEIYLVAVDSRTGGIHALDLEVTSYPVGESGGVFTDLANHPLQAEIEKLASRGLVTGYEDGSFRPNSPISRAELIKMVIEYSSLGPLKNGQSGSFMDEALIPQWARDAIQTARDYQVALGYPDGSFQPYQAVTGNELVVVMDRLTRLFGIKPRNNIPDLSRYNLCPWSAASVLRGYQIGLIPYLWPDGFTPEEPVSRSQAARLLVWMEKEYPDS